MAEQRLAKLLAERGVASRREAEALIEEGHITVNGTIVYAPGTKVDPKTDSVRIEGRPLPPPPKKVYYLLYKPRGTITSRKDPEGRKGVLELVDDIEVRVEPVGRLDINNEGALLLTNDGELAHKLTHPSGMVPKRYIVKVWKAPSEKTLERLQNGVQLDDGRTSPCKVRILELTKSGNAWIEITVTEGRNRLVRRMFQHVGHPVSKLRRESFATVSIRGMERGDVRALTKEELHRILDLAEGKRPEKAGRRPKKKGHAVAKPKARRGRKKKPLDRNRRRLK